MNINKNNYEAFFLDYHEGNLSPQQVADLLLFIEQHSELKEEFESFENITLDDLSAIPFENKSGLKKEITFENREDYFIRSVENTLSSAENILLENFIKQHPQYIVELELFQKTKLPVDASIVFANKDTLKRIAVTTDDLLIASVEGLLTKGETSLLQQQLAVDANMQHELELYKQTILVADTSVIFENKEELKRKERKVIPFFYYISGVAAAILLLFGLFFLFNNNKDDAPKFAKNNAPEIKNENINNGKKEARPDVQENNSVNTNMLAASAVKRSNSKKQTSSVNKKDSLIAPILNNEQETNNVAENKPENNEQPLVNNEQPITNNQQPVTAGIQNKNGSKTPNEFLSLRELATEKIKEKTLDENSVAMQKKNGRLKRFNGWDFAQIVTKGISKLTGRDLEVKPTYNDEGDVTAYALGAGGFQVSRGK